ncbi:MAG: two-component regulator propeller domain-containing protein, partial [Acidobacteriota bacterium]
MVDRFFETQLLGFFGPVTSSRRSLAAWMIFLGMFCSPTHLWGDQLADDRFVHLGVEVGMGGRVLDIAQDSQGFLWFAMQTGLRQYDGSRVRSYFHDANDSHSISENNITKLFSDSKGGLWIATASGRLNRWLPEEERFQRLSVDLGGTPADLAEIAPGRLLAVTSLGSSQMIFTEEDRAEPVPSLDGIDCVDVDPKRRKLWGLGRSRGVSQFSLNDLTEEQSFPWPAGVVVPSYLILDCTLANDGSLWAAIYGVGAVRFRTGSQEFEMFQHSRGNNGTLTGDDVATVLEDSSGNLWIGGFSGWNRYLQETGGFKRFTANPANRRNLFNHQIHTMLEDQTGQLWLGTDVGVARYDPLREDFRFYSHNPARGVSAPLGNIRSFVEDAQGRLWIGSRSHGIARLDRERGETLTFLADPETDEGMPDNTAWALSYEAPGRLWVGGESGLARLDIETGQWHRFSSPANYVSPRVVDLFRDRAGTLWAGNDYGIYRFDAATDALESIDLGLASRVLTITDDASGRLFLGTENAGIIALDQRSGKRLQHWPGENFAPGEAIGSISTLMTIPGAKGADETLWAASPQSGLFKLEGDGTWSHFGVEQGLPSESIQAILAEPGGTFWISTGAETFQFQPQTGFVRSFGSADGWPSVIHARAAYRSPGGELFFGGLDGFVAFLPQSIRQDTAPPRVILTDFRLGNRSMGPKVRDPQSPLEKSITAVEEVTLRHDQNDFSIELAALHFGDPARNRFAYQLEGVDSEWVETSAERSFARYSGIPAGRHLFRAKAANRDRVWSQEEAQLRVNVLPAPWRSGWAYLLYGLAAVGLVVAWIRTKTARLKLEKELQEKELKILRGLLPICSSC